MRALLERLLDEAGLSFLEWTVLIFFDSAGPLTLGELVQGQVDGRVVPNAAGGPGGDGQDPRLSPTAGSEAVYRPVRRTVFRITDDLYGDLPPADLEATHRTLA